ncbi:phosphoribulokinase [Pseudonocardia acidicola]|uniref:phosphoribulokinase n=1 Tax=Pseudonocardia acidicola TaxID=2724939 RepID=A0ABX1S681_9PSEU|nr:phosphoribulokinase [Pseudonocardia acidicola]NMH97031.1 phosphoribulokinase [Pseudonocardia acidicola]
MPGKTVRIAREKRRHHGDRPVLLAIAGDSAAGKTTLTAGLVEALGPERCVSLCTDDYHRYDRRERRELPFTALHPQCNYIEIMEQHLQLLATGQPILKPVYDHTTGELTRPVLVEPNDFVIVEGLFPLYTKLARACFDVTVFVDPPEEIRREWKTSRDTRKRGYTPEQVRAELDLREPESEAYIRPQRAHADIVVRFAPIPGRVDPPGTPLSAELTLRPTVPHPDLSEVLAPGINRAMHLRLGRDTDGRPVDVLHAHGYAARADSTAVEQRIWSSLGESGPGAPDCLGRITSELRSEPLAITQLMLLYHLLCAAR